MNNPEFMSLLVSNGFLTGQDSESLLRKYKNDAFAVFMYLVKGAAAQKQEFCKLWGDSIRTAYVDLEKTLFQHSIIQKLPVKFARDNCMIPLYKFGDTVTVAASEPQKALVLKEAARHLGSPVSAVFSFPGDIEDAIDIHYQTSSALDEFIQKIALNTLLRGTTSITEEQLKQLSGDQAVVELTKGIILLAVQERASDIHIEPMEKLVRVRFRVDGVLIERMKLELRLVSPVMSRLKILANLDITERRRPQDGRITIPLSNRSIDLRLSTVAAIYGEKAVLRVLGQMHTKDVPDLDKLDFTAANLRELKSIVANPNGVFFVTGPTGSGKSTTLFGVLKHLNNIGVNIMTIENPVEYRLDGICQVQVNHAIDLDFASALRSFLRQDPDIILVGEIRDVETAKIASQAALTGHLVLTTMHTNNAIQAVTRLIEIGVEPFLVAPSIIGVMAQRLLRRVCPHCKEKYTALKEDVERLFITDGTKEVFFYRGKGCEHCKYTGYFGRVAIHELLLIDDEVRRLISKDASILEIEEAAKKIGYKTMHYDGIKKVLRGLTTLEEVERVTAAY
ncbi:MAG: type II/IV secretion system protein [Nitrospirae bacterium]|nr:type II/IV secretion system protein [Nitrospirota bacterium]